jgi:hypothetical protein
MSFKYTIGMQYPQKQRIMPHVERLFNVQEQHFQSKVLSPVQTLHVLSPLRVGDLSSDFHEISDNATITFENFT